MTPEQRFWSAVIRPLSGSPPDSCWGWYRALDGAGYPVFYFGGKRIPAHRFSFELHTRKLETDEEIHHTCKNRCCTNPRHLEALNRADHEIKHLTTHCSRGHELSEDNIYLHRKSNGKVYRECKKCRKWHRRMTQGFYSK